MIAFRKNNWDRYKWLVNECSNLECCHYTQLEAHHIIPIAAGGLDEFDNIIILCKTCHMKNGYHSDWMLHQKELHKWKDEVDSHLVYDPSRKQWINNIKDEELINKINDENGNWVYSNPGNVVSRRRKDMKSWKQRPETTFCYGCSKLTKTYKFGKIFMCEKCIEYCIRLYFKTFKTISGKHTGGI